MIVKYSLCLPVKNLPPRYQPRLKVRFHRGIFAFPSLALVDSGADVTILNKRHAHRLGLHWDKGIEAPLNGICGDEERMFIYELEISVADLPNSRRKSLVGFVDLKNVDVLLGQIGFFEHYTVEFRHGDREFEVKIP